VEAPVVPNSFQPETALGDAGFGAGLLNQPAGAMAEDILQLT
jgi:hypothetical protein